MYIDIFNITDKQLQLISSHKDQLKEILRTHFKATSIEDKVATVSLIYIHSSMFAFEVKLKSNLILKLEITVDYPRLEINKDNNYRYVTTYTLFRL